MSLEPQEISWAKLDKRKFYTLGIGIFSGITTCLYPLTVIKTRQIASPSRQSGFGGVQATVAEIWRNDRFRGFYKGFGTVCVGAIPARVVYMSALEIVKSGLHGSLHHLGFSDVAAKGTVNFFAGASAALCSQVVFVPVDVVSQRLMVLNKDSNPHARMNGFSMARLIIQQEGLRGLWKGLFASIGTYVPNSAIWWGSYGFLQKMIWKQLDWIEYPHYHLDPLPKPPSRQRSAKEAAPVSHHFLAASASVSATHEAPIELSSQSRLYSQNQVLAVQTSSALLSGVTAAVFTTPLDVVKTRMQLTISQKGKGRVTSLEICRQILKENGIGGFMRGVLPRAANVALWGTCMVSAYEFLKRVSAVPN